MTAVLLAAGIAIGITLGDDPTAVFTLVFLIVYFTGVLILYLIALKLRERLVSESARELENKFADMPLEQAARKLIKQGIITENGFIADRDGVFSNNVIPFDRLYYFIYSQWFVLKGRRLVRVRTSPCGIDVFLQVHSADEDTVQFEEEYPLDGALFNFIDKRGFIKDYENNREFALLKQDKKNFCRLSLGFKLK